MSLGLLALGVASGIFSGLIGVGGGVIIVPALVLLFGFQQQQAQGTTLALMVPPVGLLAAWTYWKHGFVDLRAAVLICLGFFIGGLLGANIASSLNAYTLRLIFGVTLFLISLKLIFSR